MKRKLASVVLFLTAASIGLGAFGHGSQWQRHVLPALQGADPKIIELLGFVWFWVSGAMLALGALLLWAWWRIGRGDRSLYGVIWVVALFYLVEGLYGAARLGPFFLLFVVQAVLLVASGLILGRVSPAAKSNPAADQP